MLCLIDNYDSFTYNLVQYFQILGKEVRIFRQHDISVDTLFSLQPEGIVIGPGPGAPHSAQLSNQIILATQKIPLLGVCLGMQCIAECFGSKVVKADLVMHGKMSSIIHEGTGLFKNIPQAFQATRYHSLIVESPSFPLEVTARIKTGEVMALQHHSLPICGVQFHPESVTTEHGLVLLQNWCSMLSKTNTQCSEEFLEVLHQRN